MIRAATKNVIKPILTNLKQDSILVAAKNRAITVCHVMNSKQYFLYNVPQNSKIPFSFKGTAAHENILVWCVVGCHEQLLQISSN